jgi:hypothetical protein
MCLSGGEIAKEEMGGSQELSSSDIDRTELGIHGASMGSFECSETFAVC